MQIDGYFLSDFDKLRAWELFGADWEWSELEAHERALLANRSH